jgi:pimeloyl-ACP methyl ester carboxylesterase
VYRSSIPFERSVVTVEDHGGDGPYVMAIHGLGGSAGNWALIAPRVKSFGRLSAIDLPGHGRSGPAPHHDLDTHVRAVVNYIDRLADEPMLLLGNSMGSLVAELVASRRPEAVRGLVLLAPATPRPSLVAPSTPALAVRLAAQSLPYLGPLATRVFLHRRTRLG